MVLHYFLLIAGFLLLVKGADWLVLGSASAAKKFGISEIVIGLTIVAFGTSAPELVVNTVAATEKLNNIVLGNVLGSNNFNLLVILGITALIKPLNVQLATIKREIPFSLFAGLLLWILILDPWITGKPASISRLDSIILLLAFALFLWYIFKSIDLGQDEQKRVQSNEKLIKLVFLIIIGFAGLIIGGKLVVDKAILIAREYGMSERLIGLTIVSIGTSLPELATSIVAAYKGNSDLAIGNVIGSNIFNLLFILGISGVIYPINYNSAFNLDLMVFLGATLFLLLSMLTGKKKILDRWEGLIFLLAYFGYIGVLINNS